MIRRQTHRRRNREDDENHGNDSVRAVVLIEIDQLLTMGSRRWQLSRQVDRARQPRGERPSSFLEKWAGCFLAGEMVRRLRVVRHRKDEI
jgi:hypothetical protein